RQLCARSSFVYPVRGHEGQDLWYLIHGGRVVATTPWPYDTDSQSAAEEALRAVYEQQKGGLALPRPDEMDAVLLVAAWFRRHPNEQAATFRPNEAQKQIQNGTLD